jgi:hypothetical protein
VVIALLAAASGCGGGSAGKADAGTDGGTDGGPDSGAGALTGTLTTGRKVDVLFVIDDWASTTSPQQKLLVQLPIFMQVLEALPDGLPDLHLAVISADMGGCGTANGDDGVFKAAPQGACLDTTLQGNATFVADDVNGATKNFSGADLATVLECILPLGASGCGFAQPLAAVARALGADGQPAPAQNAGFLRDDADLAIILLTNQDDCSAPAGSDLYSTSSSRISDPLGPRSEYRCNEFGHLCGGVAPPRLSPNPDDLSTTLSLDHCESNEDGMLSAIGPLATEIKNLKADPSTILAVAIVAPPTPYTVTWAAPPTGVDTQPWPTVEHSCVSANGDNSYGDPAVRTTQWIASFGDNGFVESICDNSYSSSLSQIAGKVGLLLDPRCITGAIQPDSDGQPACTVSEHVTEGGGVTTHVVPVCAANSGAAPCWSLETSPARCPQGGSTFSISADPNHPSPLALTYSYSCVPARSRP